MAKPSSVDAKMLKLLTKAERQVLEASRGDPLENTSAIAIARLLTRARTLRDKWRDQFRAQGLQRRVPQRRPVAAAVRIPGGEGNTRSREKAELFADAVDRLEARLAAAGVQAGAAVASARQAAVASKTPRSKRTLANRSARASTRQSLAQHVTVKPGGRAAGRPTKLVGPAAASRSTAAAATVAATDDTRASKKAKAAKKRSKKRVRGQAPAALEAVAARTKGQSRKKAAGLDPLRQLTVATKAKSTLFRIAGGDTRTRGHVRAQGKRQQGRRDSRSRS